MQGLVEEAFAVELPDRGFLQLAGAEIRPFLQGLITNDVDRLAPGSPLYAALLTPQGKYLADFILWDRGCDLLLETDAGAVTDLGRRFALYRLRSRVTIEPGPAWTTLAVVGRAGDLGRPPHSAALAAVDPRSSRLGWRLVGEPAALRALIVASEVPWGAFEAYDRHRIRLGVPDGPRDLVQGKSILLENNFEALDGVAFDKGCFVGQELTARTKHRGLVKKRLMPVQVMGPSPAAGTPVMLDGREAGELRSTAGDLGLALLRLEDLARAEAEGLPLLAGAARLQAIGDLAAAAG